MASDRQIQANRNNAKKSTGPKTAAGKQKVSLNGLRDGLTSKQVVLPGEDPAHFDALLNRCLALYPPAGLIEQEFVFRLAATMWARDRVMTQRVHYYQQELPDAGVTWDGESLGLTETETLSRVFVIDAARNEVLPKLDRHESRLTREFFRLVTLLDKRTGNREPEPPPAPAAPSSQGIQSKANLTPAEPTAQPSSHQQDSHVARQPEPAPEPPAAKPISPPPARVPVQDGGRLPPRGHIRCSGRPLAESAPNRATIVDDAPGIDQIRLSPLKPA